ncbi:MAG: tRNA methyl transferase PRC-barrel domain-containing protein, partial [Patescibacteria group bacterium]
MKAFLKRFIKERPGDIKDSEGQVIGRHDGAFLYTIGERISASGRGRMKMNEPYYVIHKNLQQNILIASPKPSRDTFALGAAKEVWILKCNWLLAPAPGKAYKVRCRYREEPREASLSFSRSMSSVPTAARVHLEMPALAAPGQSLVVYDGDRVVGGGIIADKRDRA